MMKIKTPYVNRHDVMGRSGYLFLALIAVLFISSYAVAQPADVEEWKQVSIDYGEETGFDNFITLIRNAKEGGLTTDEFDTLISLVRCAEDGIVTVGDCMEDRELSVHPSGLAPLSEFGISVNPDAPDRPGDWESGTYDSVCGGESGFYSREEDGKPVWYYCGDSGDNWRRTCENDVSPDGDGYCLDDRSEPADLDESSLSWIPVSSDSDHCQDVSGFEWELVNEDDRWYYCEPDSSVLWTADESCEEAGDGKGTEPGTCEELPPPEWTAMKVFNHDTSDSVHRVKLKFDRDIDPQEVDGSDFNLGEMFSIESDSVQVNGDELYFDFQPRKVSVSVDDSIEMSDGSTVTTGYCVADYDFSSSSCPTAADLDSMFVTRYDHDLGFLRASIGFTQDVKGGSIDDGDTEFDFGEAYSAVDSSHLTSVEGDTVYVYYNIAEVPVEITGEIRSEEGGVLESGSCTDVKKSDDSGWTEFSDKENCPA